MPGLLWGRGVAVKYVAWAYMLFNDPGLFLIIWTIYWIGYFCLVILEIISEVKL